MRKHRNVVLVAIGCLAALVLYVKTRSTQHTFTFAESPAAANPATADENSSVDSTAASGDWPQWRGPNRDAVSSETGLLADWPDEGPPLVWTEKGLGRGMSSVSVAGGRIYTMGQRGDKGVCLVALDAASGDEIWATPFGDDGDPNGTPTVDGEHVFAISYNGTLVCAKVATGEVVWKKSFVDDFGGEVPTWGFSESPLVDGDVVVCTPGANDALVVALNKSNGETVWKTAAPDELRRGHDGAGYSSIVVSNAAGIKQYVQLVGKGVIGVSVADGKPLWAYNRIANDVANIPTPLVRGDHVFVSSGYGAGSALLRLESSDRGVQVNEVYFRPGNKMQNHHGGMVLVDDHVYLGHGQNQGLPMCVEFLTGDVKWGPVRGPGAESAAIVYADGHLYFRYQNAVMALIEATPDAYRLKASFQLPSHLDNSWPHPVIADGRLYLRDQDVLMCYDVRTKP
jgi:outer membrane protein assembly factor BamB